MNISNGDILLTLNPGSSSIKLALFRAAGVRAERMAEGSVDLRATPLLLHLRQDGTPRDIALRAAPSEDQHAVIGEVLDCLAQHVQLDRLAAVGHRVVHGGDRFDGPARIDADSLAAIEALVPLAPLHQPQSLRLIRAVARLRPGLAQVACFDTAFHRSQADVVRRFALPRALFDAGIKRYGFHGLSYTHIAGELRRQAPAIAAGRVVVAHLGSGASLCALQDGVSRDTSMAFSTLDGVPMATRCGAVDPGVLLHLLQQRGMAPAALEDMLYHQSGLLGLSGLSADSRVLAESDAPAAAEALAVFALRVARELAAQATTLGGLDGIVFTAGIGQHQPGVRAAICAHLAWLGVALDEGANRQGAARIEAAGSRVAVLVLPADEEQVIADQTLASLRTPSGTLHD